MWTEIGEGWREGEGITDGSRWHETDVAATWAGFIFDVTGGYVA